MQHLSVQHLSIQHLCRDKIWLFTIAITSVWIRQSNFKLATESNQNLANSSLCWAWHSSAPACFLSTSTLLHFIKLNSILYGCDIKTTQSCWICSFFQKSMCLHLKGPTRPLRCSRTLGKQRHQKSLSQIHPTYDVGCFPPNLTCPLLLSLIKIPYSTSTFWSIYHLSRCIELIRKKL